MVFGCNGGGQSSIERRILTERARGGTKGKNGTSYGTPKQEGPWAMQPVATPTKAKKMTLQLGSTKKTRKGVGNLGGGGAVVFGFGGAFRRGGVCGWSVYLCYLWFLCGVGWPGGGFVGGDLVVGEREGILNNGMKGKSTNKRKRPVVYEITAGVKLRHFCDSS